MSIFIMMMVFISVTGMELVFVAVFIMVAFAPVLSAGFFFLFVCRTALDATDPAGGSGCPVEIEKPGMQYLVQIHICIGAVDYLGYRLEGTDNGLCLLQFFRLDF